MPMCSTSTRCARSTGKNSPVARRGEPSIPPVKILIAPDKFKGSLTAGEAAAAIRAGFSLAVPHAEFDVCPLADGGEGTAELCLNELGGQWIDAACLDAIGRPVTASYAWVPSRRMAVVDLSAASGLWRIAPADRDPLRSNTFGTGQLIIDAIERGAETVAVGLGGSASNDAGAGIAAALGWQFLSADGLTVSPSPVNFPAITRFIPPSRPPGAAIIGLADIRSPLLGPRGSSLCYAAQKGASPADAEFLESSLRMLSGRCAEVFSENFSETPGAGAAGGTGFGLMTFLHAQVLPGFDWLARLARLDERVASADLVVTGEGSIDSQTLDGKAPGGVALLARTHGKRIIALCGIAEEAAARAFDGCFPLAGGRIPPADAIRNADSLLRAEAQRAAGIVFPRPSGLD